VHEFSVNKDIKKINNDKRRKGVALGKVAAHLCLTLIIKELKISVEQDRAVTTLNIIFSVLRYLGLKRKVSMGDSRFG
jgi:hypothetical protein